PGPAGRSNAPTLAIFAGRPEFLAGSPLGSPNPPVCTLRGEAFVVTAVSSAFEKVPVFTSGLGGGVGDATESLGASIWGLVSAGAGGSGSSTLGRGTSGFRTTSGLGGSGSGTSGCLTSG